MFTTIWARNSDVDVDYEPDRFILKDDVSDDALALKHLIIVLPE